MRWLILIVMLTACDTKLHWYPDSWAKKEELPELSEYDDYIMEMKGGKVIRVRKEACLEDAENVLCALVFFYEGEPWQWKR